MKRNRTSLFDLLSGVLLSEAVPLRSRARREYTPTSTSTTSSRVAKTPSKPSHQAHIDMSKVPTCLLNEGYENDTSTTPTTNNPSVIEACSTDSKKISETFKCPVCKGIL